MSISDNYRCNSRLRQQVASIPEFRSRVFNRTNLQGKASASRLGLLGQHQSTAMNRQASVGALKLSSNALPELLKNKPKPSRFQQQEPE